MAFEEEGVQVGHALVRYGAFFAYNQIERMTDAYGLSSFNRVMDAFHVASQQKEPLPDAVKFMLTPRTWGYVGVLSGVVGGASLPVTAGLGLTGWIFFRLSGVSGYLAGTAGATLLQAPRFHQAVNFYRDYSALHEAHLGRDQRYALLLDFDQIGRKTARLARATSRFCAVAGALTALCAFVPSDDRSTGVSLKGSLSAPLQEAVPPFKHQAHPAVAVPQALKLVA